MSIPTLMPNSLQVEIKDKLEALKRKAKDAHEQGRAPRDIPLTLQDGLDLAGLLLLLSTYYHHHHHDITINRQDRETTGPL